MLRYKTTTWNSEMQSDTFVVRTMIARFAGTCTRCGQRFEAGTEIEYNRSARTARHYRCAMLGRPRYETFTTARMTGCDGCVRSILWGATMTKVTRRDGAMFIYCTNCQTPRDSEVEDRLDDEADALLDEYHGDPERVRGNWPNPNDFDA